MNLFTEIVDLFSKRAVLQTPPGYGPEVIVTLQGRRRRSGLSRTNNLELNQLADQLELYYSHAIFGRSHLHVATYILQILLKMHDTSSYLVSQPN